MNYSTFLVKLISEPIQTKISTTSFLVQAQVQFTTKRKKKGKTQFQISLWGSLGNYFMDYYRENDYIIIQGILSFYKKQKKKRFEKNTIFTVLQLYPFILNEENDEDFPM